MNDVAIAYAELDEILNLMNDKYLEKIPTKFREFLSREKDKYYTNKIDINKPLEEQNLQRKTLVLLAVLRLKEQVEKYSTDNIFVKKQEEVKNENSQLVEYKEKNVIQKVIEKIKNFFRRK